MARSTPCVGLLALLVVLSGCAGSIPTANGGERSTPGTAPAFEAAVEGHVRVLLAVGRFKVHEERRVRTGDDGPARVETIDAVADLPADRFWLGEDLEGHNGHYLAGALYQSGGAVYRRDRLDNGTVVYEPVTWRHSFGPRNFTLEQVRSVRRLAVRHPFRANGTAVFQGQLVRRYTADSLGAAARCDPQAAGAELERITAVSAVALVDARGVIRRYECRLEGELRDGDPHLEQVTYTVTEVGTASVRPPARLRTDDGAR